MQPDGERFGPHSDLTYQLIENMTLEGTDLRQCLFTGAVFRRTVFRQVNFRRSDFDAARFEMCEFVECDLSIDMRSTLFVRTSFVGCTVGTAFITDCSFDDCRFEKIHFDDCAISHNQFEACSFRECSLTQSTFVHNIVRRSLFDSANMGDCTFLYVVMKDCTFSNCSMNLESVGMIYGITAVDLQRFRYIHLGIEQATPQPSELIDTLLDQYIGRRWRIGVAVLRLNFQMAAPLYAFHQYLVETRDTFEAGTPLNREEMLFVAKLMTELKAETRLPLATCFDVTLWCTALTEIAQQSEVLDTDRTTEVLRELSNRALVLSQDGLAVIETSGSGRVLAGGVDATLVVKFVFTQRPAVELAELVTTVAAETGLIVLKRSSSMPGHPGSWVEYLQTTVISLAAMRIFLYFINGVLYDLTEARARITTLARPRLPKEFLDIARRPQAPISPSLIGPLKAIASEALRTPWLNDPHLGGLDAPNIKSVQEIDTPGTHTIDATQR
jgi:fluoroquinolone resistance protein